jgi:GNAT superfamily N-acetyltransferase
MAIRQWKPKPLRITSAESLEQFRASSYVCTATWGSIEAADKMDMRKVRLKNQHPLRDGALSRLGWWGEQVVGNVTVLRMPVRLGSAVLETAGIAGVCADPRARKRGIASALMQEALKASKEAGVCFSLLFGIPDFYHRFHFVPAFVDHTVQFFTDTMKDWPAGSRWTTRKARPGDLPQMLALYNMLYGQMDGSALRHPRIFLRRKKDVRLVLQGPHKGDVAYMILGEAKRDEKPELQVLEASGQGDGWQAAVLREACRQARKRDLTSLVLRLPAPHPICRQMVFCNAITRTGYAVNAAAMGAVLDFAGLARAMGPEWSRRIGEAGLAVPRGGLSVRFREEYYRWWPNRRDGRTERLARTPRPLDIEFNDGLARLVMGYGEPDAVMRNYGMRAREVVMPILRAMFPARANGFSAIDNF